MRRSTKILLPAVLGAALALVGSVPASSDDGEIFTCYDENGVPSFQDDPCPAPVPPAATPPVEAVPAESVRTPPAAAAKPPARTVPKARTPAPPRALARPPAAPTRPAPEWMLVPRAETMPPIGTRDLGTQTFPTRLDGVPATASFASPERTWRSFLAAIESDDRERATACLMPAAREALVPLEDLRLLLESFDRIDDGGDLGPYWSIHGVRDKQRPKWILFEETSTGEWKIAGI
jgi:hypothetical protein